MRGENGINAESAKSDAISTNNDDNFGTLVPALEFEKNLSLGPLFCCNGGNIAMGNADSTFIFGGNNVAMWDLRSERTLCEKFGWKWDGLTENEVQQVQAARLDGKKSNMQMKKRKQARKEANKAGA